MLDHHSCVHPSINTLEVYRCSEHDEVIEVAWVGERDVMLRLLTNCANASCSPADPCSIHSVSPAQQTTMVGKDNDFRREWI